MSNKIETHPVQTRQPIHRGARATELRQDSSARRMLARRTSGSASASWPTAKVSTGAYSYSGGDPTKPVLNLEGAARLWTTPQAHDAAGGSPKRVRRHGTKHGDANLADDVTLWATPRAEERNQYNSRDKYVALSRQANLWATPLAHDWRSDQSQMTDEELYGTKGRPLARQAVSYQLGPQAPRSESGGPKSSSGGRTSRSHSTTDEAT